MFVTQQVFVKGSPKCYIVEPRAQVEITESRANKEVNNWVNLTGC